MKLDDVVLRFDLDFLNNRDLEETHTYVKDVLFMNVLGNLNAKEDEVEVSYNGEVIPIKMNALLLALCIIPASYHLDTSFDIFTEISNAIDKIKFIDDYYSKCIKHCESEEQRLETLKNISLCVAMVARTAWAVNKKKGSTVNIRDIIYLCKEKPEVRDIINFKIDNNLQFSEIMRSIESNNDLLMKYLEESDTCFRSLIKTISANQFQEVFTSVGLKPDARGQIIPKPVNTSLYRGLEDPLDYYIMALGARKALIINSCYVANAGYLGRKLVLLMINVHLEHGIDDCGTTELIEYQIRNKQDLDNLANKWISLENDINSDFIPLTEEVSEDTEFWIGQTVYGRSPITCKLTHDKKCKKCYGYHEQYTNFHVGCQTGIILSEKFYQKLLSSKHLNYVNVDEITLPENIKDKVIIDKNTLVASSDFTLRMSELDNVDLEDNVELNTISIKDEGLEDFIDIEFEDITLFPSEDVLTNMNRHYEVDVKEGDVLFSFSVENNEANRSLNKLIKILESKSELSQFRSIEELLDTIVSLLNDAKIGCTYNEIELILDKMIRSVDNLTIRPTSIRNPSSFTLLGIPTAIVNSNSITESLSFERFKDVFDNKILFKESPSIMDVMFGLE